MSDEAIREHHHHHHDDEVAVSVITPSGIYPDDQDYHKARGDERIEHVLKLAKDKLKIPDTNGWIVVVREHGRDRDINPSRTFHEDHLKGIVELEYHPPEGGGGA